MKLLWRLLSEPNNIWCRIINEKYIKDDNILDCSKSSSKSWQFNKLISLMDEFKQGIRWLVGTGTNIRFWEDNWIGNMNLHCYNHYNLQDKVSDYITPNKIWDIPKLCTVLPMHIVNHITQIIIPNYDTACDEIIWDKNPSGKFSTKTAFHLTRSKLPSTPFSSFPCWRKNLPPKINNFLWKTCADILPTAERLNRYYNRVYSFCTHCDEHPEDRHHIFFECSFTRALRKSSVSKSGRHL